MKKETPDQYAVELMKRCPLRANLIAKRAMENTSLKNVASLPVGATFYYKHRGQGDWKLNKKHYERIHAFWTQVYHIIKKLEAKNG